MELYDSQVIARIYQIILSLNLLVLTHWFTAAGDSRELIKVITLIEHMTAVNFMALLYPIVIWLLTNADKAFSIEQMK